ncbi:MAG: MDR family MFS transporter [Pseudonocardia sp.]
MIAKFRSFPRPVQLLLLNQLTINIGFYMLMPYLAAYLSGELLLATWVVGLVLGIRNFSQQGMFLVGGSLADRFGYKPLIVAGCALRTAGFGLLGVVDSLWALIITSAATGFPGALFNPAVRAYLARDAGERRVEAFALFNVFYQAGIIVGPLIGLALTGVSFQLTCLVAAGVFALLTMLQVGALPQRTGEEAALSSVIGQWREVAANRPFLLFGAAMTGSYVLSFQTYLALPLEARRITGDGPVATTAVAVLFAVSGAVTILGQLRITAWCRKRWGPARSMALGLLLMGVAFAVPVPLARYAWPEASTAPVLLGLAALVLSGAVLALATSIVFPFEMDTIVTLAKDRLVATHYGMYNTICGVGILAGNLATGAAFDAGRSAGLPELPWVALLAIGALCAAGIRALDSRSLLPGGTRTGRHRAGHGRATFDPAALQATRDVERPLPCWSVLDMRIRSRVPSSAPLMSFRSSAASSAAVGRCRVPRGAPRLEARRGRLVHNDRDDPGAAQGRAAEHRTDRLRRAAPRAR